ncbi:MAG: two-component system OmpR family phosphate regulon response regulator OmpR [Xanthobacteraceae bacterium]|nr:MAG: two-component system OmpR family phosphate regulon response regulator OmpR [Xanthobacteraceae bacterium]
MTVPARPPEDDAAHLLIVDDDRVIRQTLARYLTNNGYRVTTAGHAAAARKGRHRWADARTAHPHADRALRSVRQADRA